MIDCLNALQCIALVASRYGERLIKHCFVFSDAPETGHTMPPTTWSNGMSRLHNLKRTLMRNRIRPVKALIAVRRLIADPDDTGQVFKIIEALKGDSIGQAVTRLQADATGSTLLAEKPNIVPVLNDRQALLALPESSIGRAYYRFVHEENLSADGLVASSEEAPEYRGLSRDEMWLGDRLRDIHDLQHVMTGYGRDRFGELCLLSFMTEQTNNRGINFIIAVARRKFQAEFPQANVAAMIKEGRDIARGAMWMPAQRWEDRLGDSLEETRREMGFLLPERYLRFKEDFAEQIQALAAA